MYRKNTSCRTDLCVELSNSPTHEDTEITVPSDAMKAQRGIEEQLYSFSSLCARCRGGWLTPQFSRFTPQQTDLGRPQGRSGRVRKNSPPTQFDHRPVQSLYRLSHPALQTAAETLHLPLTVFAVRWSERAIPATLSVRSVQLLWPKPVQTDATQLHLTGTADDALFIRTLVMLAVLAGPP